jgi:NAD(P)-dependent dehydrogenase (short-subunit alcohol dehydrogenase family)
MNVHTLFDLTGRVAMVSGAAQGMGRAMATALAEAGADVMLVDKNAAGAQHTADEIAALGRKAAVVACDVSDVDQVGALFERLDRDFGRSDFLGNVAGEGVMRDPLELTTDELKQVLQNLVVGRFFACQQAARRMVAQGRGSIVNIGSIGGFNSLGRGHIAYGIAMAGVIQMTRELSTELSGRGVRVNCILPAQVWNPGLASRAETDPKMIDVWMRGIPRGRFGQPDDIKGLAVLLASDASSWITGAIIPMDGGNLAMNAGGTKGPAAVNS